MTSGLTGSSKIAAFLFLLLLTPSMYAADGVIETRSRWAAKGQNREAFDVVEIDRLSEAAGKSAFLVTHGQDRYVILDVSDFAARKFTKIIRNTDTGEYLQATLYYQSVTSTRTEFLAEMKREAALGIQDDHAIVFKSHLGEYTTRESQLYTPATQKALADIVTPRFSAALRSLQNELLGYLNLQLVCRQVVAPLTGGQCALQSAPTIHGAKPDCDVDASFGFPCTASQRARSTQAAVHKSTATRY